MVTISQVAAEAGVSIKTVSRVLNNEDHVRPHLRERVLNAAAALQYRPNLAARQLAAKRSFLISLIVANTPVSYFSRMIVEAASECRQHNYHLVSDIYLPDEPGEEVIERVTSRLRPDGIILLPPLCNDAAVIAAIERLGTPLVRLAGISEGYGYSIQVEERAVSRDLVAHLISLGHRRIGLIGPPADHQAAQERTLGYRDALAAANLAFDPELVITGDFSFASGVKATAQLLARSDRPSALFATNDGMALGAMAVARKFGLRIPDDIAIAGFDDSPGSRMIFPALTTVRQPVAAMARNAVLTLLDRPGAGRLNHELLLRGSTTGLDDIVLSEMDA